MGGFRWVVLRELSLRCSGLDPDALGQRDRLTRRTSLGMKGKQAQRKTVVISADLAAGFSF
jgi:hypothetical protein